MIVYYAYFLLIVYNIPKDKFGRHTQMDSKINPGLEEEYSQLLLASKNEKSVKQKKRYDTVLLYMEEYARKQIAEILHIPHRTVCYHIASYQKGGLDALLLVKQP